MPRGIIPDFDPWDGGVAAEILYLLEAPGAKAGASGFISRDNNDETAKNFLELNRSAFIERKRTLCWNAVPWYIGTGTKIRPAKSSDIREGLKPLFDLLHLLPDLRAIVLIGRKAEYTAPAIELQRPDLKIFKSPHPSPLYCNHAPGNRENILKVLRQVGEFVGSSKAG